MQFVITAYDGTDPEAATRRSVARPAHLERAAEAKSAGHFIAGGAILNDSGDMIGSTLYVEFESRNQLEQWIAGDPYVTGGVWKEISIQAIRLATVR